MHLHRRDGAYGKPCAAVGKPKKYKGRILRYAAGCRTSARGLVREGQRGRTDGGKSNPRTSASGRAAWLGGGRGVQRCWHLGRRSSPRHLVGDELEPFFTSMSLMIDTFGDEYRRYMART